MVGGCCSHMAVLHKGGECPASLTELWQLSGVCSLKQLALETGGAAQGVGNGGLPCVGAHLVALTITAGQSPQNGGGLGFTLTPNPKAHAGCALGVPAPVRPLQWFSTPPRSRSACHHHACCVQGVLVACTGEKVENPAQLQGQLSWKPGRTFEFYGKTEEELQEGVTLTVHEGRTSHVTLEQVKGFSLQQAIDIWREYLLRWGLGALSGHLTLNIDSFLLQRGNHVGQPCFLGLLDCCSWPPTHEGKTAS